MTDQRSTISILFANPNLLTRDVMMQVLNRHQGFHVVASATTAQEVLDSVRSTDVDVALISATLADGPLSGLGVLREVCEHSPKVRSVILFYSPERYVIADAFRAGARGVLCLSQSTLKLLTRCVEQVHAGQIWANSSELAEVVEALSQLAPMRVVNADGMRLLTNREEDVVRLVAEGLQNREIAKELKLSEHTVRNYLFHAFDKLGVSSRVEMVLYAVSNAKSTGVADVQSDKQERKPVGSAKTEGRASSAAD